MKRDAIAVNGTAVGVGNAGISFNLRDGRDGKSDILASRSVDECYRGAQRRRPELSKIG
jgi:hypothetical protein